MSSWSSRCFTMLAVSFEPSVPASGLVLMPIVTERLGSSTVVTGSGLGSTGSGDRLADRHVWQARERNDLAGAGLVCRDAIRVPPR